MNYLVELIHLAHCQNVSALQFGYYFIKNLIYYSDMFFNTKVKNNDAWQKHERIILASSLFRFVSLLWTGLGEAGSLTKKQMWQVLNVLLNP